MNRFFVKDNAYLKNVLFKDTVVLASDENYKDEATFLQAVEGGNKKMLDTHLNIAYNTINKIIPYNDKQIIQLFFANSRAAFQFDNAADYQEMLDFLLKKTGLNAAKEKVSNGTSITRPILYTLVAIIFSISLILVAKDIENGKVVSATGSKKGMKQILITLAETLGFWGSITIGVIVSSGFLFYTITRYKNSKEEQTVYKY